MIRTKLIYTLLLLCTMSGVFAQQAAESKRVDLWYRNGEYSKAIEGYLDYLVQHADNKAATIRLARCYENTGDYLTALTYYDELIQLDPKPSALYLLKGNLLKKMMRFDAAIASYSHYKMVDRSRAISRIKSCRFAKELASESGGCDIENLSFNSKQSDYNPTFVNGKLVYTSKRGLLDDAWVAKGDQKPMSLVPVLYEVDNEESPKPFALKEVVQPTIKAQSLAYQKEKCAYVIGEDSGLWEAKVKSSIGEKMQIVLSSYDAEKKTWIKKDFPYNNPSYSNGFPHLTNGGNTLFFASNMPGGYGKFDVYVSYLKEGVWTKPLNLGEEVNTMGNEISPYLEDDKLYFASDYHYGLGGYDIFRVYHRDNAWGGVENLGACINSPNDDYGMVISPADSKAYFTSNRIGGKGHEDIYAINQLDQVRTKKVFTTKTVAPMQERVLPLEMSTETPAMDISDIQVNLDLHRELLAPIALLPKDLLELKLPATELALKVPQPVDEFEAEEVVVLEEDPTLTNMIKEQNIQQKVYFVQIAALSHKKNMDRFKHFRRYGNVYQVKSGGMIKVRIGFFNRLEDARRVAGQLKAKGIREAFIVGDNLQTAQLEIIATSDDNTASSSTQADAPVRKHVSPYKIRVVSYHFPNRINTAEVADLGKIEHWTKEDWKIIILSGYENLKDAQKTLRKVHQRGFKDAYIVKETFGKLQRVRIVEQ